MNTVLQDEQILEIGYMALWIYLEKLYNEMVNMNLHIEPYFKKWSRYICIQENLKMWLNKY